MLSSIETKTKTKTKTKNCVCMSARRDSRHSESGLQSDDHAPRGDTTFRQRKFPVFCRAVFHLALEYSETLICRSRIRRSMSVVPEQILLFI
jgi:hypothetical protein